MKQMLFPLPMGQVILQWPDEITVEWLDLVEEVVALQLRSIRRCAEGKARDAEARAEVLDV